MTRIAKGVLIIEPEAPAQCQQCGKIAELRPYGPGGISICYECGELDPEGTQRRCENRIEMAMFPEESN
jgi:hypothetical protein